MATKEEIQIKQFIKACQDLEPKYRYTKFNFKGKNAEKTVTLKKRFSVQAEKYFYKNVLNSGTIKYPIRLVKDLSEISGIDVLELIKQNNI